MPADREEVAALREEGIEVVELARPVGLRVEDGRLAGLVVRRTAYDGTRDAAGRKVPRDVPGSDAELPLDTLILAISQSPVLDLFGDLAPELTRGRVRRHGSRRRWRRRSRGSGRAATWRPTVRRPS